MVAIKLMRLRIAELYKELNQLEKAGCTPANLERVKEIEKQANGLRVAIQHKQRALGMHVA